MCNRTVGVSSASLPNSQFGDSREDSLSYVIIIVIYFIIHIMSLRIARIKRRSVTQEPSTSHQVATQLN